MRDRIETQHGNRAHPLKAEDRPAHGARRGLSIPEHCNAYGISRSMAYSEIKAGRLRVRKVGRRTIIATEDAEAWFAACARGA